VASLVMCRDIAACINVCMGKYMYVLVGICMYMHLYPSIS